jgi:histidinol-phosphate aminotransferase
MAYSRRAFLRAIGAGSIACVSTKDPLLSVALCPVNNRPPESAFPGKLFLNNNENAYGPSPRVLGAIEASLQMTNRFPNSGYEELVQHLTQLHGIKSDQILIGCGSRQIIQWTAEAFLGPGKKLMQASPTFEAPAECARAVGATVVEIPLNRDFSHDLERMLSQVDSDTTLLYICNPNNPTGTITPLEELDHFLTHIPLHTHVIIDEAYHDYVGRSAMYSSFLEHSRGSDRVLVSRTFSKVHGLAALRLGYAIGDSKTVQFLRRLSMPICINRPSLDAAMAALQDREYLAECVRRNEDDRQEFFNEAMDRMLRPLDSNTNFFMMNVHRPAREVIDHFRRHNVLLGPYFPGMDTYVRVAMGRPVEMKQFWKVWDLLPATDMSM